MEAPINKQEHCRAGGRHPRIELAKRWAISPKTLQRWRSESRHGPQRPQARLRPGRCHGHEHSHVLAVPPPHPRGAGRSAARKRWKRITSRHRCQLIRSAGRCYSPWLRYRLEAWRARGGDIESAAAPEGGTPTPVQASAQPQALEMSSCRAPRFGARTGSAEKVAKLASCRFLPIARIRAEICGGEGDPRKVGLSA
jgi:hypothetical protein